MYDICRHTTSRQNLSRPKRETLASHHVRAAQTKQSAQKPNNLTTTQKKQNMYLFFDTETTGLPKNWKAPVTDLNNWPRLVQFAFLKYA
jgi:uncharacterized protein YprB with RNaseH-like and TPR domain